MKKTTTTDIFLNLLRKAIGSQHTLPAKIDAEQWKELFDIAKKQTLIGILYCALDGLEDTQRPPKNILMQWIVLCERIKSENKKLNEAVVRISDKFREEGWENVVLKGQGVALLYPNPLYRMPGDIDIWLDGKKADIIKYVRSYFPDCKPVYHHVDFPMFRDIPIEIHFTPTWMNNYFMNRKLQKYFGTLATEEFKHQGMSANGRERGIFSSLDFNRVYILIHIYRHLFSEGIGLRQLLDYYYVLKQGFTDIEKQKTLQTLKELGMMRFAGATMYVLQTAFGLEDKFLLVQPLRQEGEFLLDEIMLAGNFGHYDERIKYEKYNNPINRLFYKTLRNLRFVSMYPSEVIWSPLFKAWHFFWRKQC